LPIKRPHERVHLVGIILASWNLPDNISPREMSVFLRNERVFARKKQNKKNKNKNKKIEISAALFRLVGITLASTLVGISLAIISSREMSGILRNGRDFLHKSHILRRC
jgi:hypothetical protein